MFKRFIASFVCVAFVVSNFQYVHGSTLLTTGARDFSINQLPVPGSMVNPSESFAPLALKGLVVNPQKPLEFQFIVDTGDDVSLRGKSEATDETISKQKIASPSARNDTLRAESTKLIKYFLAGLTIPEGDLWVNLSPYEKSRITTPSLGQTELGRDLLAQDYILKQLTASLIYPEKDLGKEFWNRIYKQAQTQFGTINIPVNTFNKVWILPDQAQVFEHGNAAYVTKATLKVMLDEDYTALQKHTGVIASEAKQSFNSKEIASSLKSTPRNDTHTLASHIVRTLILPAIEKEVNTGKNFAALRQIYQALILAKWYKETIQNGLLDAVYTNKSKIAGVNLSDPTIKQQIYNRYLQAYKKGVFNYIKEDPIDVSLRGGTADEAISKGQTIPRKYFSGGTLMQIPLKKDGAMSAVKADGTMVSVEVDLQKPKDAAMNSRRSTEQVRTDRQKLKAELDKGKKTAAELAGITGIDLRTVWNDFQRTAELKNHPNWVKRIYTRRADQAMNGPVQQPADAAMTAEKQKTILVAEDRVDLLNKISQGLTDLGYKVVSAEDGQPALDLIKANPDAFDLVVTDIDMPKLDGIQLAQALIKLVPSLPVIVESATYETVSQLQKRASNIKAVVGKGIPGILEAVEKSMTVDEIRQKLNMLAKSEKLERKELGKKISESFSTMWSPTAGRGDFLVMADLLDKLIEEKDTAESEKLKQKISNSLSKSFLESDAVMQGLGLDELQLALYEKKFSLCYFSFGKNVITNYNGQHLLTILSTENPQPDENSLAPRIIMALKEVVLENTSKKFTYKYVVGDEGTTISIEDAAMKTAVRDVTVQFYSQYKFSTIVTFVLGNLIKIKSLKLMYAPLDNTGREWSEEQSIADVVGDNYEKSIFAPGNRIRIRVKSEVIPGNVLNIIADYIAGIFSDYKDASVGVEDTDDFRRIRGELDSRKILFESGNEIAALIHASRSKEEAGTDRAMTGNEKGGIDLNPINLNHTGKAITVQFDPAQLNELLQGGFEGFSPVIINITPIQSPLPLLGVAPRKEPESLSKV